jgi:tetratricopeptide (TPR) repeat protein
MKLISRDPQRQALEAYARAKSWPKAAQLAIELGDEAKMVSYSLMAALGRVPPGLESAGPQQAALHLASAGHHRFAAPLFAHAGDHLNAGRSCLAAKLPEQAVSHFERAGAWQEVVRCHQDMGRPSEALRSLDRWERALERDADEEDGERPRPRPSADELRLLRAELLLRVGRTDTAANLLRSLPPSSRRAELLERAGKAIDAVQGYLAVGDTESAHRLNAKVSDRDRDLLLVKVHMRDGRPTEAGHLLARMGLHREAAEAYEAAGQWAYAGGRWEASGEAKLAAQCYEKGGQWTRAGRCYANAGMTADAVDAYVRGGDLAAAADLHVRAGRLLDAASLFLNKGQPGKAAPLLMRIGAGDPTFALATLLLVPLLIEEGFAADALDRLARVPAGDASLDGQGGRMERVYWQGRALEALGRGADAQACYSHLLDFDPGYRDALGRLERLRPAPVPAASGSVAVAVKQEVLAVGGRVAGRYDIEAELGRGGMGRVFKARDLELGETVAIKGLLGVSDGGHGEEARLLQELQICRRISHPNVVRVFDLGRFPGGIFITMEFLEGRRLDELIAAESPLPFATIHKLVAEIAAGLHEAHALGIVHRDLKPSNVMITATRLKILDFGIAAMAGAQAARLTQAGFVMGSPMFMSPDQLQGLALDGRSDLYSLGLLAYNMITGREPFAGMQPHAVVLKQLRSPPPPLRSLRADTPEPWVAFVDRLLAKNRDDRFQTAGDVLAALPELSVS